MPADARGREALALIDPMVNAAVRRSLRRLLALRGVALRRATLYRPVERPDVRGRQTIFLFRLGPDGFGDLPAEAAEEVRKAGGRLMFTATANAPWHLFLWVEW